MALTLASVAALAGYVWAGVRAHVRTAVPGESQTIRHGVRWTALASAWCVHLLALVLDISGWGQAQDGARFGFAPALSMTIWLVLTVYLVESRFYPLHSVRRVLALLAAVSVVLAWCFPGELRASAASAWAPLHWLFGLASYALFGVAVLHAALMNRAEQRLRLGRSAEGLPVLRLERLTFQFVTAGVVLLSLAILLGWWFTPQWKWDHKNLLSMLGWLVLAGLLAGRRLYGWRGRRATRWLYAGASLLLLAYVGTRFVLEVILQRPGGLG
jgi:ABC-type uncharacterized transport system permease subunit